MATAAELRQILKEDSSGQNLYEHLTNTLMKILVDRPKNAFAEFENISAQVKTNPTNPDPEFGRPLPPSVEELEKQLAWTANCAKLLKVPEEPPEDPAVKVPELLEEAALFEWAGIAFGRGDIYRLLLSIRKLAESLPGEVEKLRFFGRITTRSTPYYIVEGLSPDDEENTDEKFQEGRNGANKNAYWVTQNVESAVWTKLPNVTCAQIVAARQFKRFFTGNLQAPVPSYPPFNGNEANLLRTQIACIVGSTSISPDGYYTLSEDDPPVVITPETEALNESFPKSAADLKDPEGWKHHEVELNKLGRVTALPEQLDDAGEVVEPEEPVDVNPPLDAIKPEQWAFRVCPGGAGSSNNSVVAARSLLWPGAVAVTSARRYVNVYVGNGVSYSPVTYSPPMIGAIQSEWVPTEDSIQLVDQPDTRVDPTPPVPEGEGEEE